MIDPASALLCLALNVYHEARGEPLLGQHAVAHVTLNRAKKRKLSVCDVVFQPYQFSWTLYDKKVQDERAWAKALQVAQKAMKSSPKADPTGGATYFHTPAVNPSWNRHMKVAAVIGGHIFYIKES